GGPGEHDVLHGGQPGGVDVFDDLHEYGCVMVGETPVPVQDRADEQVGAGSLPVRGGSFLEQIRPVSLPGRCTPPAGRPVGAFEAVDVDVHATDPSQSGFLDQALQEFAAATAQIDDAADPFGVQHGQDRTDPLFGQVGPAFLQVWCGGGLLHRRVVVGLVLRGVIHFHEAPECGAHVTFTPVEIAAGDPRALWMFGEPPVPVLAVDSPGTQ